MTTTTSTQLAAFIGCREALVSVAYQDGPNMSIGFGSNDPTLKPGDTITIQDAFTRLKADIKKREPIVAKALTAPVNQVQFDAIFDLFYQSGTASLNAITSVVNSMPTGFLNAVFDTIANRVTNNLTLDPISAEFQKHAVDVNGGGTEINPGLLKRRNMEIDLFWRGDYGDLSSILVFNGNPKLVKPTTMPFDYESFSA